MQHGGRVMVKVLDPIRRVWLCSQVNADILEAARRLAPDVHCVSHSSVFPDNVDQMMPEVMQRAWDSLQHFDFDRDVLGLVGDPFVMATCLHVVTVRSVSNSPWCDYPDGLTNAQIMSGLVSEAPQWRIAKYDNKFKAFLVHVFPTAVGDSHGKTSSQKETDSAPQSDAEYTDAREGFHDAPGVDLIRPYYRGRKNYPPD